MKATVIVCTYNRCESLAGTSRQVLAEIDRSCFFGVGRSGIDNNSAIGPPGSQGFLSPVPGRFRYVFEPRPGKICLR